MSYPTCLVCKETLEQGCVCQKCAASMLQSIFNGRPGDDLSFLAGIVAELASMSTLIKDHFSRDDHERLERIANPK